MKSKVLSVLTLLLLGTTLAGGVEAQAAVTTNVNRVANSRSVSACVNNIDSINKLINNRQNKLFSTFNVSVGNFNDLGLTSQVKQGNTVVTAPKKDTVVAPTTPVKETVVTPTAPVKDTVATPPVNETSVVNDKFMANVEQAIFNKVNEERAKAGVSTLSYNTTMEKYARIKSQDMGDNNYFSHEDLQGSLITTKMKADGVSFKSWGENIAYIGGVSDPTALANQFMTNWMNSEGHRKNILSTNFESIGVGVYKVGNKVYATQEFYK